MADKVISYKGANPEELLAIACKAVALWCDKDPELVTPDEDGQLLCSGDSSAVIVYAESDPAALVFQVYYSLWNQRKPSSLCTDQRD